MTLNCNFKGRLIGQYVLYRMLTAKLTLPPLSSYPYKYERRRLNHLLVAFFFLSCKSDEDAERQVLAVAVTEHELAEVKRLVNAEFTAIAVAHNIRKMISKGYLVRSEVAVG